ncbi:MAG: hypothetical protein LBJ69_02665 [Holosporales bacterium]|jgi:hypothetical protein|nr:hypothetical protein [Holosporales bacterium]
MKKQITILLAGLMILGTTGEVMGGNGRPLRELVEQYSSRSPAVLGHKVLRGAGISLDGTATTLYQIGHAALLAVLVTPYLDEEIRNTIVVLTMPAWKAATLGINRAEVALRALREIALIEVRGIAQGRPARLQTEVLARNARGVLMEDGVPVPSIAAIDGLPYTSRELARMSLGEQVAAEDRLAGVNWLYHNALENAALRVSDRQIGSAIRPASEMTGAQPEEDRYTNNVVLALVTPDDIFSRMGGAYNQQTLREEMRAYLIQNGRAVPEFMDG